MDEDGFVLVPDLLSEGSVARLDTVVSSLAGAPDAALRPHGIRNLATLAPGVSRVASSDSVASLVEGILGVPGRLVRSILFDKIPGANWKVPWHQDLTIAVENRIEVAGFGPWSVKDGVRSVQPPVAILEGMVTVRLHLDDCGPENGALRVIRGSHRSGRLTGAQIDALVGVEPPVVCTLEGGGALVMRPLLLHASSQARSPKHRRVVHLDFAAVDLPNGLRWSRVA